MSKFSSCNATREKQPAQHSIARLQHLNHVLSRNLSWFTSSVWTNPGVKPITDHWPWRGSPSGPSSGPESSIPAPEPSHSPPPWARSGAHEHHPTQPSPLMHSSQFTIESRKLTLSKVWRPFMATAVRTDTDGKSIFYSPQEPQQGPRSLRQSSVTPGLLNRLRGPFLAGSIRGSGLKSPR